MKRILFILLALGAICVSEPSRAQSLDDLMKSIGAMFSTSEQTPQQKPAVTTPTLEELIGRLKYDALAIDYTGDSSIASLAVATLESQLPMIAEKFGFVVGRDYIDVSDDGSLLIVCDGKGAAAYCSSYDQATGRTTIMMRLGEQNIYVGATVLKSEGRYRLLFDATELFSLMEKHYPAFAENTTLVMIKGVVDAYPGIRVGVVLRK